MAGALPEPTLGDDTGMFKLVWYNAVAEKHYMGAEGAVDLKCMHGYGESAMHITL